MPRKHHWGLGAGILKTQVASEVLLMEGRLVLVSKERWALAKASPCPGSGERKGPE